LLERIYQDLAHFRYRQHNIRTSEQALFRYDRCFDQFTDASLEVIRLFHPSSANPAPRSLSLVLARYTCPQMLNSAKQ
jgi:hypothetical protein